MRAVGFLIGCSLATARAAHAQERAREYAVKAAYLISFLNYVEWPVSERIASRPITICLLGGNPFGDVLPKMIRGRQVNRRRIQAIEIDRPVEADRCDVGFIAADANPSPAVWLEALDGRSVLTVGEEGSFAAQGGVIAFVIENQTVRFEVNLPAARTARLQVSSRLLRSATRRYE